ncbi:MAG: iron-sulfur cluster carrier protein ApbC [Candidatus Omnitrophica bacterium]|nr:iron-sulfur cluster carrier protein ApbC [Candidatus Omnitrophota bacterium]
MVDQPLKENQILEVLRTVKDPDLHRDIVSLGFIKNLEIKNGTVKFDIVLTTPACPVKDQLKEECESKIRNLPGVSNVQVTMKAQVKGREGFEKAAVLPGVRNIIAVASGKGGVGKSTVTANLALALRKTGAMVGLLDCDVYGPSMPLMFGLVGKKPGVTEDQKILPLEAHGIRLMSIGFLTGENTPVIWRGPMVHQMIQQFLTRVAWGELDYLLLDLPPGTGDTQLTLTQSAPLSGAVIVTTPQEVSLIDARKGLQMFWKVNVPVLGVIENMSYFVCPDCGKVSEIFKAHGGEKLTQELKVPLIGQIPIDPQITETGDQGTPIVAARPESQTAKIYQMIAGAIAAQMSIVHMKDKETSAPVHIQWKVKQ